MMQARKVNQSIVTSLECSHVVADKTECSVPHGFLDISMFTASNRNPCSGRRYSPVLSLRP